MIIGHLTLELSSYLLEIPNVAYKTLVNSDWLYNTLSRVLQADWFILEISEKAILNINLPILFYIGSYVFYHFGLSRTHSCKLNFLAMLAFLFPGLLHTT